MDQIRGGAQLETQRRFLRDILVPKKVTVYTVGHSTHTWQAFLILLKENRIERLVDVRHYPSSSIVPWTNHDTLRDLLAEDGIAYVHLVNLGGYRKPEPGSRNKGLRNAGFRGYADYMSSDPFLQGLDKLLSLARAGRTAVLCAEAVPWRCHRSLLSDALLARGAHVVHILGPGRIQDHRLTSSAKVHGGRVSYPSKA